MLKWEKGDERSLNFLFCIKKKKKSQFFLGPLYTINLTCTGQAKRGGGGVLSVT